VEKSPQRKEGKVGKMVGAGAQQEGSSSTLEPLDPCLIFPFCSFWVLINHRLSPAVACSAPSQHKREIKDDFVSKQLQMHSLRICNLNSHPPSVNSDGWLFPTALRALGSCTADAFLIYGLPLHGMGNKQPNSNYSALVRIDSYIASILLPGLPTPPLCS